MNAAMNILALSSSRVGNSGFLERAIPLIQNFLGDRKLNIAFIPFASVERDYETYGRLVQQAFDGLPYTINVVQSEKDKPLIDASDVIMTGGGNTFKLLHDLYHYYLMESIKEKVQTGTPYIGWSAGANLAGPTISTTNDMPIIQPASFKAFCFFPFQINPHYLDQKPDGYNGETRDQRIGEFVRLNPTVKVVGLLEGTGLLLKGGGLRIVGDFNAVLFGGADAEGAPVRSELDKGKDLSYLL
jgi:dipeptidase E